MIKKLTKGIEDLKKEKERLVEEKEKLRGIFKEIEQKAFTVQENYKNTQKVLPLTPLHNHNGSLAMEIGFCHRCMILFLLCS